MSKKPGGLGALASKQQILAQGTPKFQKSVVDAKLIHGDTHIAVARALTELGEHCLSVHDVENLIVAKASLEESMKIQVNLAGGKFSKGVYVWPEGYPPEEFVDSHYKLGQVLAAQATVTGESETSRSHLQKTLGMREDYDKHMKDVDGQAALKEHQLKVSGVVEAKEHVPDVLGTTGSSHDSTLVYSDSAEEARMAGDFKEAEFLLLKALGLRRRKFGSDHVANAPVLMKYAEVLRMQFKFKHAKKALDEALAINMSTYGPEHPSTAEALNNLGQVHRLLGNHDEAEALLLEALQLRRKLNGDFHLLTASTLNNLAELNREKGDFFQAINYHNAAIESFTEAEGAEHPGTINAKGNLGVTMRRQARHSLQEGEALVKEAFQQLQAKQYDDQHPWLVKFGMEDVLTQAGHLSDQGKHDESLELYDSLINKKHVMAQLSALGGNKGRTPSEDTLGLGQRGHGDDPEDDAHSVGSGSVASRGLRGTRYGTKDADDNSSAGDGGSVGSVGSGLSIVRRKFRKPVSQDLLVLTEGRVDGLINKAAGLFSKGKYGDADGILNAALVPSLPVLGDESQRLYKGTLLHCEVKIMLAQYELSNEMLVDVLQRWTDLKGPDHIEVAHAAALLAYLYYIQGMYDAAHTLYVQVMEVVGTTLSLDPLASKRTGAENNVLYCKVLLGLVKCNLKMANVKDALVALTQARDLLVNTIVSESPLHLELRLSYARLRVFGGEYKKANKMYRDCLDMAVGRYGKSHATVAYLLHKIGLVEYLQGNLAVAAAYVEEALYMRLKIFKDDHPDVAATEQLKGLMITDLGRYDEAAVLCERAMVTQRIALGPRHPAVARSLLGLGQAFCKKGLPLEAVEYCSHALDINREVFGRLEGRNPGGTVTADMHAAEGENAVMPHPVVSSNLAVLGSTYVAQGLYMQGQLLLEQALGEMEMVLASLAEVEGEGPDNEEERYPATHHLARAHVQRELARAYMLGYEGSDATKLITAAGATFATICGEGSFFVADCVAIAADISHHEGRYRDAQVQYSRASVIHTTEQGPQHPVGKFEIALRACRNTSVVGYLTGTLDTVAALLKEFPQSSLPQNGKVMADLFMVQAHVLFDQEKFQNASNVATQAMEIYKEAVGIDSVLHVSAVLLICDCSIKLGDLNDVKVRLGMCITKARAAVEHPDNSNTGSLLNYKDKHPILGEIASSLATLANPKFKPGQVNLPALQIMEAQVSPLYNNRCGAEHSAAQWAAGRLGIYMNLDKRKTGDELLNGALASFESAGEATEEAGGQLFFTADSRWVASLGGYATQRLKVLKSTHEKHINVQPYCAWALVPLSTTPGDDGSVGTMGTGNVSRASGVIIDGVGKGPKYPECPAADAVQLTPGGASPWGFLSYGAGKADGSGSAKREAVKPSKRGRGDDKRSEPGNGILALAVFNGEAPVSMAVSNMFGAADAEHVAAIQKAEARARAAAVEEAEQLARELLERNDRDDMSIASNSLMSGDGNFAAMSEEERIVLESLRVERACEEEEVERLKKERDDAEEAMLAIKAQREEEEEATNKAREELAKFQAEMELFRQKHEAEMTRVKHEMTAAQSVAQAQAVPDDTVALHAVDAVVEASAEPVVADEAAEAPPSGGSAGEAPSSSPHESSPAPVQPEEAEAAEEASIAAETAADQNGGGVGVAASEETGGAAVAVAITDPFPEPKEEIAKKSESAAEATAPAEQPLVQAVQAPIVVQSSDAKAKMALDAAHFLFDRAVDFRAKGWYSKSRPVLAECLAIRESMLAEAGHSGPSIVVQTKFEVAVNLMDMCLWSEAIAPLEACFKARKEAALAKGGGSNGMGNGKHRDLAEVIEAQARNFYSMSMYTEAQHKFHDAVKMRVDTMTAGDPQIGRCICAQSMNMALQGKFLEAKATAEKGHAILTKAYGTKNVATAEGFACRVEILRMMGKYKEANPLMQQCVSLRRRLLENNHPLVGDSCMASANLLIDQDRYVESEKWISEALEMYSRFFDEKDVRVISARVLHCKLLRFYGKHHEAITLHTEIYQWRKEFCIVPKKPDAPPPPTEEEVRKAKAKQKMLDEWDVEIDGPKPVEEKKEEVVVEVVNCGVHRLIAESLSELTINHLLQGDYKKGNNFAKATLKMCKTLFKDCMVNPAVADALFWRGEGQRFTGDMERARQNHDDAMDLRKRALGKDHAGFGRSQAALADVLANRGLYEEAEALYRKALKQQKSSCTEESLDLAHTLNAYAECMRHRNNYDVAAENNEAAMAIRCMQMKEVNPNAFLLLECAINSRLIELDQIVPPVNVPAAAAGVGGAVDEDDESFHLGEDDDDITGVADDASAAQSKALSVGPRREKPGFEVGTDELRDALTRDANGVVVFHNQGYVAIRAHFKDIINTVLADFTALAEEAYLKSKENKLTGDDDELSQAEVVSRRAFDAACANPLFINVTGNVAVVDKLEAEAKERFMFSLTKDDKKLFEAAEKRALLDAPSQEETRALEDAQGGEDDDNKSVTSAAVSVESSIQGNQPSQAHLADDEKLPQYMLDLDSVIALLSNIGCSDAHPWHRKFTQYRKVVEKPPSEMEVAFIAYKTAEKSLKSGLFTQADLKYDEAITLQIEHLGHIAASTSQAVAETLLAKARNCDVQCKFALAKTLYMQAFAIHLKIEGVHATELSEDKEQSRPGSPGSTAAVPAAASKADEESPQEPVLNEGCAMAYYGLASLYLKQGSIETAHILHQKVFKIRKRLHVIKGKFISKGNPAYKNHPSIMQSMSALAGIALDEGDLPAAREQAEAAMDMCVKLGRDDLSCYHVDHYGNVCDLKQLLGRVCLAEGDLVGAEEAILAAQADRRQALNYLSATPPTGSLGKVPDSGDSVASNASSKADDHADFVSDYYYSAQLYKALDRLHDAKKAVGKCMRLSLKHFGRLKQNAAKLSLNSKQFLENILESQSYPEIDLLEKRLITQAGNTSGGVQEKVNEAFGRDPNASNDNDLASLLEDGSLEEGSVDQASAQYAASQAVVMKALELRRTEDGERLPAFMYKNIPVSNHILVANALNMRADVALAMGDLDEARLMCDSSLNIRKEMFGRKALAVGQSLSLLARITEMAGVLNEAMSLHVVALDLKMQFCPNIESHPEIIDSQLSIGSLKLLLCQLDEGYSKLRNVTEKTIHRYGREHPRTGDAWLAEAEYYFITGDFKYASNLVQKALKVFKDKFPEFHGRIGRAIVEEARVQMEFGMLDISMALVDQGMSHYTMVYSGAHYHNITALLLKSEILMKSGKVLEAKSIIESCLTARRDLFGKANWRTAQSLYYLATNLFGLGRYATAQPIFERAVQLLRRALGFDNMMVAQAMVGLGECYVQNAEYDKAKTTHDNAYSVRVRLTSHRIAPHKTRGEEDEEDKSNMHPAVAESLGHLAQLHLIHGSYSLALRGFDDALAMRRATLGHMHADVAASMHSLGVCYFEQGEYQEAKQILERALKMRKTVLSADHFHIVDTQFYVARVYQVQGKLEQASAMYERCLVNQRISRGSRHAVVGRVLWSLGDVQNSLGNFDLARSYFLDSLVIRKSTYGVTITAAPEKDEKGKKKKKAVDLDAPEEEAPAPKLNKFHPEIAETLFGLAENYRHKGRFSAPEKHHLSDKGEEQLKNESGMMSTAQMKQAHKDAKYLEDGSISSSKYAELKAKAADTGVDSDSISLSTPGKEFEDHSVVTVNLAAIESKFAELEADMTGDFDEEASLASASVGGLNDYVGPQDSPVKGRGGKKKKDTLTIMEGGAEIRDADEEYEFAMPLYERCLDMALTLFGNEHPLVLTVQQGIAQTLQGLGSLLLSHDLFQHVLHHRRGLLGDNHTSTCESFMGVADALRAMSHIYPTNTAAAAEKRVRKLKVTKGIGPSLVEYLSSILGADDRLKTQWPPEVTHDLTLIAAGRGKVVMHPLLKVKGPKLENKYPGGYMGYAYSPPKKLARDRRFIQSNVTRPAVSFLTDAKWIYDTALASCKQTFGDHAEHPLLAALIFGKAELMRARKEMDEAMQLYEQSLNMRRHILKGTHPAISDCLVGMAETLRFENKFNKAEPLLIKAIQIRQNTFPGEDSHPSIPDAQCSLAMLYYSMGRYLEAQPLYAESLHTREKLLGRFHISTAQSLNNFAGLLHTTGKFERALPYYRRTLEIKIEVLGEVHPDVASAKNNLGLLLKAMGSYDESKKVYEEALSTFKKTFGEMHADVASTLNNMAALYVAVGNTQKGKDLYRESLHIKKKVLGIEHTSVAASLNNLAGLCFSCGDMDDAKDYYEESLRIRRDVYGDEHPTVAESMNNIGLLLFSQGDFANSRPLFEKAIAIKSESYGDDHVSTASSQHNLAILLHKMKRFSEAEALYVKALNVRTETLGAEHPDTLATSENMNALIVDKDRLGAKFNRLAASRTGVTDRSRPGLMMADTLEMDNKFLTGGREMTRTMTPKRAFRDDDSREGVGVGGFDEGDGEGSLEPDEESL